MIATTGVEHRTRPLRAARSNAAPAEPSVTQNGPRHRLGSWSSWAFCVSGTERRLRPGLVMLRDYADEKLSRDAKLYRMSQKVIQFPGARTAAGDHSGIVLRIGPRLYRLDILHPATGRDEPEDEVRPLPAPPRCRGIPVGDGTYTGCAYGRRRPRAPDWAVRLPYLPGLRHRKETTGDPAPVQYPKSFAPNL